MRLLALVGVCVLAASFSACGGGNGSTQEETADDEAIVDSAKPPKIRIPPGPPPDKLVVRDIRTGSGPAIPANTELSIRTNYISMSYRTRKPLEVRWTRTGAFNIGFGPGLEVKGWEKGLVGMKVGGRRELKVPSKLAYDEGAILYVVDLLGIERRRPGE